MNMILAINNALDTLLERDPSVVILGEDVLSGKTRHPVLARLEDVFADRIFNRIPLVEDMLGGIALGLNFGDIKPVIQFDYPTFITLALDGIYRLGAWRYRTAENDGPGVVIRVALADTTSGGADISMPFLSTVLHLPNITIAIPSDPYHAKGLLKTALRSNKPVLFFETKTLYETKGVVPRRDYTIPFGASSCTKKGTDVTIISWSYMSRLSIQAAEMLHNDGIEAEVITLHTLYPLDKESLVASAKKTGRIVIAEEEMERGGIGAEICAQIAESIPGCHFKRIAAKNVPVPPWEYKKFVVPGAEDIFTACKNILS